MSIELLTATNQVGKADFCQASKELPLKRVAAYCRVSTKVHEQLDSLAAQERYYEDKIRANPNWQFVGVYSDVGSGTTVKGRKRFNALIESAEKIV